jgi:hypothetical protein
MKYFPPHKNKGFITKAGLDFAGVLTPVWLKWRINLRLYFQILHVGRID